MIPQKVMEVVQLDYVTCVKVDEGNNFGSGENTKSRIVAAKQTTLFEAEDKGTDSKQASQKKNGQQSMSVRKISSQGGKANSLMHRYHGKKEG